MKKHIKDRRTLTLPRFIYEKFRVDEKMFNIPTNELINRIINIYIYPAKNIELERYINKDSLNEKIIGINPKYKLKNGRMAYTLQKDVRDLLESYLIKYNLDFDLVSNFILDIFKKFYDFERYERERLLYFDTFIKIKEKIKNNNLFLCRFKGTSDIIEDTIIPLDLKIGVMEGRNYLVVKSMSINSKKNKYYNIKLSNIIDFEMLDTKITETEEEKIEALDILENFDETLSYYYYLNNGPILVEFDDKGKILFEEKILAYKPKKDLEAKENFADTLKRYMPDLIDEKDSSNKVFLVANDLLASKYLSQFYEHVKIIGPLEIRNNIRNRLIKMCEKYDIKIKK